MPLGKVFDPREGQVFTSPVSNYYQGKAVRADITLREKQAEALQMEIDNAPAAAAAAARKEQRDIDANRRAEEAAAREVQEALDEGKERETVAIGEVLARYSIARKKGATPEDSFSQFKTSLIELLGEEGANEAISEYDRDNNGFFGPEEERQIFAYATEISKAYAALSGNGGATDKNPVNMILPDGTVRAFIPGTDEMNDAVSAGGRVAGAESLSKDDSGISDSAQSFILRMVTQHFGGVFDEATGQVKFLDPSNQRRASQITTLASDILAEGVVKTSAGAVKKAMKAYGEKWEDAGEKSNDEIPEEERTAIIEALSRAGNISPTEDQIQALYKSGQ